MITRLQRNPGNLRLTRIDSAQMNRGNDKTFLETAFYIMPCCRIYFSIRKKFRTSLEPFLNATSSSNAFFE